MRRIFDEMMVPNRKPDCGGRSCPEDEAALLRAMDMIKGIECPNNNMVN